MGLSFLLLPALGFLQWRWIDELAEAESARLSNFVTTGAERIATDLEEELASVEETFRALRGSTSEELAAALLERLHGWRESGAGARWVRDLYWVDPAHPDSPGRVDPDAVQLTPSVWPDELRAWRDVLTRVCASPGPVEAALPSSPTALLLPQFPADVDASSRPFLLLIVLDEEALRETLLPQLVATHLSEAFGPPVHVQVTHGGRPLFRSVAASGGEADAIARLSGGRMEIVPGTGVSLARRGRGRTEVEIQTEALRPLTEAAGPRAVPVSLEIPDWEVHARHSAGSIALAVANARRRNLALGLGTLGVLTIATVLLVLAARRARRLARRQLEFVAGITHELRTPLTVIRSASENLAEGVVDDLDHARDYGRILLEEGRRLTDLVDQALTLAGATESSVPRAREDVDLRELVADILERSRTAAELDLEVDDDLPRVSAERLSLERAVSNLVANAIKYAGADGRIRVRLRRLGADEVELVVSDSGPGIPPSEQSLVFEPFYRGRAARESQTPGSGLGLSVVRGVVEALGGVVTLESPRPASDGGQGAAFTLRLPAAST